MLQLKNTDSVLLTLIKEKVLSDEINPVIMLTMMTPA